jgi:hypothetical protein
VGNHSLCNLNDIFFHYHPTPIDKGTGVHICRLARISVTRFINSCIEKYIKIYIVEEVYCVYEYSHISMYKRINDIR